MFSLTIDKIIHLITICSIVTGDELIHVKIHEIDGQPDHIEQDSSFNVSTSIPRLNSSTTSDQHPFSLISSGNLENSLQVIESLRKDFESIRKSLEKTWPQSQSTVSESADADKINTNASGSYFQSFIDRLTSIVRQLPIISQAVNILMRTGESSSSSSTSSRQQLTSLNKSIENNDQISNLLSSLNQLTDTFNLFHHSIEEMSSPSQEINKQEDIHLVSPFTQRVIGHLNRIHNVRGQLNENIRSMLTNWINVNNRIILPGSDELNKSFETKVTNHSNDKNLSLDSKHFILHQVKQQVKHENNHKIVTPDVEKAQYDYNVIRNAASNVTIETFQTFSNTIDILRQSMTFLTQIYTKLFTSYLLQVTSERLYQSIFHRIQDTTVNIANRIQDTLNDQILSVILSQNRQNKSDKVERNVNQNENIKFIRTGDEMKVNSIITPTIVKKNEHFDPFISSPENPYGNLHPLGVLSRELNQIIDLASSISNFG